MDLLHYLLVRTLRTIELYMYILNEVCHKEVTGFLHMLSVVGTTYESFVMAPLVASSVVRIVNS